MNDNDVKADGFELTECMREALLALARGDITEDIDGKPVIVSERMGAWVRACRDAGKLIVPATRDEAEEFVSVMERMHAKLEAV